MDRNSGVETISLLARIAVLLGCFGVGNLWAATPLSPQGSASEWLAHMAKSVRELNYRGKSILMNGDQMSTVEVIHGVFDGEPWERVIHLSGEPAEILRRGKQVSCLHPDALTTFETYSHTASITPFAFHSERFAVPKYYRLSKSGTGRVAGRETYRVDVVPKDSARFGYQFWLDAASGLLLKSVIVNEKGRGLEMFEFVDIQVDVEIDKQAFKPGKGLRWVDKPKSPQQGVASELPWQLDWLPAGFTLAKNEMRMVGGVKASTKVYSDGLAAFSVFLEPVPKQAQTEGTRTHGATTALSRRLAQPQQDYLVTVVGEIPMATAMQVAMAVQLED